jgi:DnaJ-class molecular chaperone
MALVSVTCSICDGRGIIISASFDHAHKKEEYQCNNCHGEGAVLVHTGSLFIGCDPAGTNSDSDTWVTVWQRQDGDRPAELIFLDRV